MAVRLFRSTDASAPALSNSNAGSLITILRACLVEGFGTRTSAGWTMPFSDLPNNKAAFQSVSGDCIQIDDNSDYRWASALGFKTMSALDTGTEQYPNSDQVGAGNEYRVYKRYSSDVSTSNWAVIASDNWFYFINHQKTTSPSYPAGFFFGDYDCVNPSFTENNILTGYLVSQTDTSATLAHSSLYTSQPWFARRNYQSAILPEVLRLHINALAWDSPNPFTGSLDMEKVYLRSENSPYVRYGSLPNHFRMLGSNNLGYRGGELFDIAGDKYIVLAYTSSAFAVKYDIDIG